MMKAELIHNAKTSFIAMESLGKNEEARFEILIKIYHTFVDDIAKH